LTAWRVKSYWETIYWWW